MATPMSGVDILLKINTGTDLAPVWEAIACQRGASLKRSADTVDVSYKGVGSWKAFVAGLKGWSVDCNGLYVFGATEFEALESAFDDRTSIKVEIVDPTGKGFSGTAFITDFPIEAPYDGELTYKLTLQGNGALEVEAGE